MSVTDSSFGPASFSEAEQDAWGVEFGASLPRGAVVAMHGDLGAGKTTLARAICKGLGVLDASLVTSPTFAIIHEYETHDGVVVHADLYRLKSELDLDNLGWDELLARARAVIVEWPDRAPGGIPSSAVHVSMRHDPDTANRRIVVVT